MLYDHEGEPRYPFLYPATVVENADPQMLGRVRFRIEGLLEPASGWAFPVGGSNGGGSVRRGALDVPKIGATVLAGFLSGDIDHPIFFGAWRGIEEPISQAPVPGDADKVQIYESDRFVVVMNGIPGAEEVLVMDKRSPNKISMKPTKITIVAPQVEIGGDGLASAPLLNGVVLASGIDTLTGATYGALGSASSSVTAKKA